MQQQITNTKIVMPKKPIGLPNESNFKIMNEDLRDLEEKEVLVKTIWLSLDPYMRGTMNRIDEGEVMMGEIIGEVIRSNSENYKVGEIVLSKSGWQMFSIADESTLKKVDKRISPISLALGSIGMPGLTAYFGLFRIGNIKKGETVVVSAASGAVGSVVGQIAKEIGCTVVGIAGSEKKVNYIKDELKFDYGLKQPYFVEIKRSKEMSRKEMVKTACEICKSCYLEASLEIKRMIPRMIITNIQCQVNNVYYLNIRELNGSKY